MKTVTTILMLLIGLSAHAGEFRAKVGLATGTESSKLNVDTGTIVVTETTKNQTAPLLGMQYQLKLENGVVIDASAAVAVQSQSYAVMDGNLGYLISDKFIAKVGVNVGTLPSPVNHGAGFQLGFEYQMTPALALEFTHSSTSSTEVTYGTILTNHTITREMNAVGLIVGF